MNATLSMLLGLSLSGTVLAVVVMLLRRILGDRLPSAFYYYAWLVVLLRFVLPLPGLMPDFSAERTAPSAAVAYIPGSTETGNSPIRRSEGFYHMGSGTESREFGPAAFSAETASEASNSGVVDSAVPTLSERLYDLGQALRARRFWLGVWVIGTACTALWYGGGYLRFRRELSATLCRPKKSDLAVYDTVTDKPRPRLRRSRAAATPMLVGVFRPIIVLPDQDYSETMLQGVLAHEITHCRRHDVLYKWFAVLVSVIHWFNPITLLFRYELDRSCELACDERLLRHMDAKEKRLYGEMLITMAANRRLPRSVVATSFAVEKRNLKERLSQIMTYNKRGRASLALILAAVLLLSACGAAAGPGAARGAAPLAVAVNPTVPEETAAPEAERLESESALLAEQLAGQEAVQYAVEAHYREVTVSTMDEFLAAIASNTVIFLEPGTYDLSDASDYGQLYPSGPYTWSDAYDGHELIIRDVENLVIAGRPGENGEPVLFSAEPRYAQVLRFENCRNLILSSFTAGHTQEPGQCAGGVLYFDSCYNSRVTGCRLYGCGILGIQAVNCDTLFAESCAIYECSVGAVSARGSRDIRLLNCDVYSCGGKVGHATSLFDVWTSTGFAVINSNIHENDAVHFLRSTSADEVYVLGTEVNGNVFDSLFAYNLISPTVGGCSFSGNTHQDMGSYEGRDTVFLPGDGGEIAVSELENMTLDRTSYPYEGPVIRQTAAVTGIPSQDGMEYHVSNVDEFLSVIGSDTTIYLDGEMFDLSTATNYGGYGGDHYYWIDNYDGPGLVISGVENLRIIGQGKNETTLQAVPRYSDVLCFENSRNVSVAQLTAGHLREAPGSCSGDVIAFESCEEFYVVDCGLFGCGVYGLRMNNCVYGNILRTEIYECSGGAAAIFRTDGVTFLDCSVHDCKNEWDGPDGLNSITLADSGDCTYNGVPLHSGANNVGDDVMTGTTAESPSEPELGIYFYEKQITRELGGITMRVGEEPIQLIARRLLPDGSYYGGDDFVWSVSDESALQLTPGDSPDSCWVAPIQAVTGGVTLMVRSMGATYSIPVYIVN